MRVPLGDFGCCLKQGSQRLDSRIRSLLIALLLFLCGNDLEAHYEIGQRHPGSVPFRDFSKKLKLSCRDQTVDFIVEFNSKLRIAFQRGFSISS